MSDRRVHYDAGLTETYCHVKITGNVKVTKSWGKVTCDNCKKIAGRGWE
jgi:hypothetical protein